MSHLGTGTTSDRYSLDCDVASLAGIEPLTEIQINLFPNPASETLTISLPENTEKTDCILFDKLGKEVRRFIVSEGDNQVDISELESGIYLTKVGTQLQNLNKH